MKAIIVEQLMDPADLVVSDVDIPEVGPGEIRVDVRAAGCNFFDILLCRGKYQFKPDLPFIPGAEVAGVVNAVGDGVDSVAVGDRVYASIGTGAYAEQCVFSASLARPMSSKMSFPDAAALAIVYPTAYAALVTRGQARAEETVAITAAAGGCGLAAVQIARALGTRVIALAGGEEKLEVARQAGADECVDYGREDWIEQLKELTKSNGVDVAVESVGGDIFDGITKCLAWRGRLVVNGFASGKIPEIRANRILLKNISIVGLHWGPHLEHEPETVVQVTRALGDLYDAGKIAPQIWKQFSLAEVPIALQALAERKSFGKVIVSP